MLTLDEFKSDTAWYMDSPEIYPPGDVYWITFAGHAFTGLTIGQWAALHVLADATFGYKAIMWCHAPKDYPSDHFYNVPTHAEVKSNA